MFSIDRRAKRRRTGVAYTPGRGPTLTNKANFVLMNGKIVDRSQFMGVNFKDDTRNQTFVNIAEAGYASDAIASRGVASDGPINVQAAGQSMVNIRELAGFLGMLVEDDEKVANLLSQYKTLFAEMYHIQGDNVTPHYTVDEEATDKENAAREEAIATKLANWNYAENVYDQVTAMLEKMSIFYTPSRKAKELTKAERVLENANRNAADPDFDKTFALNAVRNTLRKGANQKRISRAIDPSVSDNLVSNQDQVADLDSGDDLDGEATDADANMDANTTTQSTLNPDAPEFVRGAQDEAIEGARQSAITQHIEDLLRMNPPPQGLRRSGRTTGRVNYAE